MHHGFSDAIITTLATNDSGLCDLLKHAWYVSVGSRMHHLYLY